MPFNVPIALTWLRILLIPVFVGVFYLPTHLVTPAQADLLAMLLFVLAAVTDWLDGYLARAMNQTSAFGAFLDPVADKLMVAAALIPVQIMVGDLHGLNTLKYQPAKLAAMEGIWETQKGVPAVLFAIPDQSTQSNRYEIAIPKLASFYLTHDWNGEIQGIKEFGDQHPPVGPVFWAFRIMVGVGLLMLAVSWFASYELKFKSSLSKRTAMVLVAMTFAGWVALISGWYVTEIGRQPWLVHGVLTTAQAASQVPAGNIALSLAMYLTLYVALLSAYVSVVFYLAKKAVNGDHEPSTDLKGMRHA